MSKKKVTAPLSYDPGKGRPKEYLAYLNWQEMQELMRINGNNVELGPRGLPSFPPDDAIGSNQTPGTGNWTGSPGSGTTSGGAGGTTGGGSDSGTVGGSVGGTTTSTASTSSAGSQQASNDTEAQQTAAQQNAAEAARNEALRQDAARSGINSINVGPMQNPVKIGGGQIFGSLSSMAQQVARPTSYSSVTPTMPGGGGMGQYNARVGSLTRAVGPSSGIDAFGNIARGSLFGTDPSAARKYDSLDSDLTRRALFSASGSSAFPSAAPPSAPSGVFGPRADAGIPSYLRTASMPGMITTGMPSGYSGVVREKNTTVAYKTPEETFTDYAPTQFETEVPYTPYRPTVASGTFTSPYNAASPITPEEQQKIDMQYQNMGLDTYANIATRPSTAARLESVFANYGLTDTPAEYQIAETEEQYRQPPGVSASVIPSKYNYPVKPDGTPYTAEDIANLPPDIQKAHYEALMAERMGRVPYNLTEAQRNKIAVAKGVGRVVNYNPLTRAFVTGSRVLGGGLGMLPGAAGEFGEGLADAAGQIRDPGAAVEAYETASPLQQVQMEVLAGKPNRIPGASPVYTGTTYAGGAPTRELGGKGNEFRQFASYTPQYTPGPAGQTSAREGGRPQQYYLWDLGVGIPSPGDPDYNDYQKYLRERGTSAAV